MTESNRIKTKKPGLVEAFGSDTQSAFVFDPGVPQGVPAGTPPLLADVAALRTPTYTWGATGRPEDLLPLPLPEVAGAEVDVSGSRGPVRPAMPTLQRMPEPERPTFDEGRARRLAWLTAGAAGVAGLGALFGAPGLVHFASGMGGQTGRAAEQDAIDRRRRLEAWRDGVRGVQAQNIATGNQQALAAYAERLAEYRDEVSNDRQNARDAAQRAYLDGVRREERGWNVDDRQQSREWQLSDTKDQRAYESGVRTQERGWDVNDREDGQAFQAGQAAAGRAHDVTMENLRHRHNITESRLGGRDSQKPYDGAPARVISEEINRWNAVLAAGDLPVSEERQVRARLADLWEGLTQAQRAGAVATPGEMRSVTESLRRFPQAEQQRRLRIAYQQGGISGQQAEQIGRELGF